MKKTLLSLLALMAPAVAADDAARGAFGVVPQKSESPGVTVEWVWPGCPAERAGLSKGDVIVALNGQAVANRDEMAQLLKNGKPGDTIHVQWRSGNRMVEADVELFARPKRRKHQVNKPELAVGADRMIRPLPIPDEIRSRMREHRRNICAQLAMLPDGMDKEKVIDELQAIRDLARDAAPNRPGWMHGRAGESSVHFRDGQGRLLLHGANGQLQLEVFDSDGQLLLESPLNTPQDAHALPADVLERLQTL